MGLRMTGTLQRRYKDEIAVPAVEHPMPMHDRHLRLHELSETQARVLIARDVILQLDENKLVAKPERWVTSKSRSTKPARYLAAVCSVCAIGAVFVAAARREGAHHLDLDCARSGDRATIVEATHGAFSHELLREMEYAFECYDQPGRAALMRLSDENRMRAIMNNIIDHDGRFDRDALVAQIQTTTKDAP